MRQGTGQQVAQFAGDGRPSAVVHADHPPGQAQLTGGRFTGFLPGGRMGRITGMQPAQGIDIAHTAGFGRAAQRIHLVSGQRPVRGRTQQDAVQAPAGTMHGLGQGREGRQRG